jgi:hypothetical protein
MEVIRINLKVFIDKDMTWVNHIVFMQNTNQIISFFLLDKQKSVFSHLILQKNS